MTMIDTALVAPPLSAEQLAKYEQTGVLVLRDFLGAGAAGELLEAWGALRAAISAGQGGVSRVDRFILGPTLPGGVGEIFRRPRLVSLARQILGEDVALYMNRILLKDAGWSGSVSPHQDMVYFHGGLTKLAVFVPLAPMTHETGGLKFIAGSHNLGNLGARGVIQLDAFPSMPVLAPDLKVGDVCLMNFLTWHYSEAATAPGGTERPVLQLAYQPADDGSYYANGVPEPTLVCGAWRTKYFVPLNHGIKPDTYAPGTNPRK